MQGNFVNRGKGGIWKGLAIFDQYTRFSEILPNTRNAVLMYHAVGEEGYDRVSTDRFRHDISYISSQYEIVDLDAIIKDPTTDQKKVAITFDDALKNVYNNAVPVLREFNAPATIFAVADYLNDGSISHKNRYMDMTQLHTLVEDDLFTLGNHTKSHPHLERLAKESAIEREVVQAKADLEDQLGTDIERFSYPYGSYTDHVANVVSNTHRLATTTESRLLGESPDRAQIPRIDAKHNFHLVRWELSDASEIIKRVALRLGLIESVNF